MRYRLRTLVLVLTIAPPMLATFWWPIQAAINERRRACSEHLREIGLQIQNETPDRWKQLHPISFGSTAIQEAK
jgi:hypothetical protein